MTNIQLDLERLTGYGSNLLGRPTVLTNVAIASLGGGYTGAEIYRLDLDFLLEEAETRRVPLVLKYTTECEAHTMRVLAGVPQAACLPQLIDCGQGLCGADGGLEPWLVMPFYEGKPLSTTDDEVPAAVIDSLARLHAHFASRLEDLSWAPRFDIHAFRGMLGWVLDELAEAQTRRADERLALARDLIRAARESPSIEAAFACLPVTLIHGDVHGGNILQLANGGSVLIDWGNARLAPAMFDLANMVEIDSPNWQRYWATWQSASGQAFDEPLARLGYHLATVVVNSQYLPFAVRNWPNNTEAPGQALEMIERLENAVQAMAVDM